MNKLSIIMPTYNGARFLQEQIESILSQSFTGWDLVACDDGSNDETAAILARAAERDGRVRMLPSSGNRGQKKRLQELLAVTRADLIAVADQDDVWAADKLSILMDGLGDADLCFGSSWFIDEHGRELGRNVVDSIPLPFFPEARLMYIFRPAVSAHAMIARRSLLEGPCLARARPFDWLLSLDAVFAAGATYIPAARTMHRMHGDNQMNGRIADGRPPAVRFWQLALAHRRLSSLASRRVQFLSHVEHLAFSSHVDNAVARAFLDVHAICWRYWYGTERGAAGKSVSLMSAIEPLLRPLAGSERDWNGFTSELQEITQSPFSPRRIAQRAGRARTARAN